MPECPWYEERKEAARKRLLGDDPHHIPAKAIPHCGHPKHAPALGPGEVLKCEGSFGKCPLTEEQRADV